MPKINSHTNSLYFVLPPRNSEIIYFHHQHYQAVPTAQIPLTLSRHPSLLAIPALNSNPLKLVDHFVYVGRNISSIESGQRTQRYGMDCCWQVNDQIAKSDKIGILLSSSHISTTVWLHYLDSNGTKQGCCLLFWINPQSRTLINSSSTATYFPSHKPSK